MATEKEVQEGKAGKSVKPSKRGTKAKGTGKKVLVTQVRSSNGQAPAAGATLSALGLGRIGKEKAHVLTPSTDGMIKRVQHLVRLS